MPEIAKCPKCKGTDAHLRMENDKYLVQCNICLNRSKTYTRQLAAIAAWNRRAQSDGCEWEKRQIVDSFGDTRTGYHCSNCGFLTDIEWPFCPKCGAKMAGKRLGE